MPHQNISIMPKNDFRPRCLLQYVHKLIRLRPSSMVSRQPTLRAKVIKVLLHYVQIRGKVPGTTFFQVDLHDAQSRNVTGA
jgi:hypothetical protein